MVTLESQSVPWEWVSSSKVETQSPRTLVFLLGMTRQKERDTKISILTEKEMELRYQENILNALNQCNWKITGSDGAAELLGIKPTTLHSKIKKMGLKRPG